MRSLSIISFLFLNVLFINSCLPEKQQSGGKKDTEVASKDNELLQVESKKVDVTKIGRVEDEPQLFSHAKTSLLTNLFSSKKASASSEKSTSTSVCPVEHVYSGSLKAFSQKDYFIAAKVNNDVVTNVDIMNSIRFIFFSSGKLFDKTNALLMVRSILAREIYNKLQEQVAKKNDLRISDVEINKKVSEIAERNGISVLELEQKFIELGISMPVFKANIAARMLFSSIVEAMKNDIYISQEEVDEEIRKTIESNKHVRYKLYEIHLRVKTKKHRVEVLKTANMLLKLLGEGFSFPVLAESVSQGNYRLQVGDLGWVPENSMEKSIKKAVKALRIGQYSNIVETSSGLTILYLDDKAEPNKAGFAETSYKYMKAHLQYKGELMTSKDSQKSEAVIEKLKVAKAPEEFRKICKENNIELQEFEEQLSNPFLIEIVEASFRHANTMQSPDDEDYVDIFYIESKNIPDATALTKEEAEHVLISKKVAKAFQRNFKQAESVAFVDINEKNLSKILLSK